MERFARISSRFILAVIRGTYNAKLILAHLLLNPSLVHAHMT